MKATKAYSIGFLLLAASILHHGCIGVTGEYQGKDLCLCLGGEALATVRLQGSTRLCSASWSLTPPIPRIPNPISNTNTTSNKTISKERPCCVPREEHLVFFCGTSFPVADWRAFAFFQIRSLSMGNLMYLMSISFELKGPRSHDDVRCQSF